MKFLSQELPSHSNRRARFNQTQLRGCFVDAIGLETTCAICIAPRWHSVVNLGDVDGRIERPMVSDQARDMSGADATTSVWPYDRPTPTHSLGPCFPVLPLRQNCARKNKPWGQPLEQNPTDVTVILTHDAESSNCAQHPSSQTGRMSLSLLQWLRSSSHKKS